MYVTLSWNYELDAIFKSYNENFDFLKPLIHSEIIDFSVYNARLGAIMHCM